MGADGEEALVSSLLVGQKNAETPRKDGDLRLDCHDILYFETAGTESARNSACLGRSQDHPVACGPGDYFFLGLSGKG
jgi:hypothetical protein